MKTTVRLLVWGVVLWSAAAAAAPQTVVPERVEVEDGDTLLVTAEGVDYRIQLPHIDAPERTMNPKLQRDISRTGLSAAELLPLGEAASAALRRLLASFRPYSLIFDPDLKDRYGRTPGDLLDIQDRRLGLRMVEAGYAIPARPPAERAGELQAAMQRARDAGNGLWGKQREAARIWAGLQTRP